MIFIKWKEVLSKKWYINYSFRDPKTEKLKRQTNIKGDAINYIRLKFTISNFR